MDIVADWRELRATDEGSDQGGQWRVNVMVTMARSTSPSNPFASLALVGDEEVPAATLSGSGSRRGESVLGDRRGTRLAGRHWLRPPEKPPPCPPDWREVRCRVATYNVLAQCYAKSKCAPRSPARAPHPAVHAAQLPAGALPPHPAPSIGLLPLLGVKGHGIIPCLAELPPGADSSAAGCRRHFTKTKPEHLRWDVRRKALLEVIAELDADIVILQVRCPRGARARGAPARSMRRR